MAKNIQLIINPSEITAGTRGASLGPYAIMTAARTKNNSLFGQYPIVEIPNQNLALDQKETTPNARHITDFAKVFHALEKEVITTVQSGKIPVILSGAHGSAAGTISGLRRAKPNQKLGVIWIDAHADMHSPYTTPSGNVHGMPLGLSLGFDNLECQVNQLSDEETSIWNELKNSGDISPKIDPENLVFAGVRDTEEQEDFLLNKHQITNHKVEDFKNSTAEKIGDAILEQLKDCDWIYLSFDVDSMDPDITSYGTGTPVKNGLHPNETKALISHLLKSGKVGCFEIVEVNPCLDNKTNTMAEIAFEVLENSIKDICS